MINELEKYIYSRYYEDKDHLTHLDIREWWEYLYNNDRDEYERIIIEDVDNSIVVEAIPNFMVRDYNLFDSLTYSFKNQAMLAFKYDLESRLKSLDPEDFELDKYELKAVLGDQKYDEMKAMSVE